MSARPKIKQKVVKATIANKDVLDMFNGVVGNSEGTANLTITWPKYNRIKLHVERFIKLLTIFRDSKMMNLFPVPGEHLGKYVFALNSQLAECFGAPDLSRYFEVAGGPQLVADDYSQIPPEVIGQFGEYFANCKKCNIVNTIIVTCKNLVGHKKSIEDANDLKDRFILKSAGVSFCPLPDLPQVNFKQIYIDDRLSKADKEFVLVILHKMYTIGHDLYEAVSSPDVDVDEFVEVIMSSIGDVKKHIPRCDQAFAKISESVSLLKNNFGNYYKDYVASNNPTIIMEGFVLDVAKDSKASPGVTAQFRRIIGHYRKIASQQTSNPKLQTLFQQVDKNFQELESKKKAADAADDDEYDDTDATDATDATVDPEMDSTDCSSTATSSTTADPTATNATAETRAAPAPTMPATPAVPHEDSLADEFNADDD